MTKNEMNDILQNVTFSNPKMNEALQIALQYAKLNDELIALVSDIFAKDLRFPYEMELMKIYADNLSQKYNQIFKDDQHFALPKHI